MKNKNKQPEQEFQYIKTEEIDYSPLNYRKYINEDDLQNFAKELQQHGMISPVTVRRMPTGKYELVAGERRLRAANIAGLREIPAVIKDLDDENVIEIQLAENIQRENPHPMHEAMAIGQMRQMAKSIDEIAKRLGKSKQYVYSRIKLINLAEDFREMFLNGKMNIQEANEIATLSHESQQELYEEECSDWREQDNFELGNLEYLLRRYKYDLASAPFDPKDKNLLPEAGACTKCASNTATLKTFFPEEAKQSICSNKACYHKKCAIAFTNQFTALFEKEKPEALIFYGQPPQQTEDLLATIPAAGEIPKLEYYALNTLDQPIPPDKEDYEEEEEYGEAVKDYAKELEQYNTELAAGHYKKGMLISRNEIHIVLYNQSGENRNDHYQSYKQPTAKEVQSAIKTGTATKEMLQNEIFRINNRECRAQEIAREKIQVDIHAALEKQTEEKTTTELTDADKTAARLIIYQSLDYFTRNKVFDLLDKIIQGEESLIKQLANLSERQYAYLVRMAILCKPESKRPDTEAGQCVYAVAKAAGLDIEGIEQGQQKIADKRRERQKQKIEVLEGKIAQL